MFFGTPEFAVASLDALCTSGANVVAVVTAPDKPAGRGKKLRQSAVKEYAVAHDLPLLQPTNMKSPAFQQQLRDLKADVQVVVAFRMMPQAVWDMPPHGTFNLHASLLPQYRGAAPINWAIINGETETGVTTFFLRHEIDTGSIAFQEKVAIAPNEDVGTLYARLMKIGAQLVVKTWKALEADSISTVPQEQLLKPGEVLNEAPKLNPDVCHLNWSQTPEQLHNRVRGLSPYPAAFTMLPDGQGEALKLKIFVTEPEPSSHNLTAGTLVQEGNRLKVACSQGFLQLHEVQLAGKRRMPTADFLNGMHELPSAVQ